MRGGSRRNSGQKPKSAEYRALSGTRGAATKAPREADVPAGDPVAPAWLDERQREWFARVVGWLTATRAKSPTYSGIVTELAVHLADEERYTLYLREHDEVYESDNGKGGKMWRARPEVRLLSEVRRRLPSLLAELGLTPVSVTKAAKSAAEKVNTFLEDEDETRQPDA